MPFVDCVLWARRQGRARSPGWASEARAAGAAAGPAPWLPLPAAGNEALTEAHFATAAARARRAASPARLGDFEDELSRGGGLGDVPLIAAVTLGLQDGEPSRARSSALLVFSLPSPPHLAPIFS